MTRIVACDTIVQPQGGDGAFNARVANPAYVKQHPKVLFDEAHNNPEASAGRYMPFVDLVTNDGYRVTMNKERFTRGTLKGYDVLVIVNASGPPEKRDTSPFTEEECNTVREWVSSGGALFLITDHSPFSSALGELAKRFDVELTRGFTIDKVHHDKGSGDETELVFTKEEGLLGEHPITRGRDANERINKIISFSGTSLTGPKGSVQFLKLSDSAIDILPSDQKPLAPGEAAPDPKQVSAAGRAQGVALAFGKGRVVVLGEAAMITAQVALKGFRFGMNVSGFDNRQLALNMMHWLSGAIK